MNAFDELLKASGINKKPAYAIKEVAALFSVAETTVRAMIANKTLKSIRLQAIYRIPIYEVERLLNEMESDSGRENQDKPRTPKNTKN